jgi:tyrosyl-tRNA synthetase
MWKYWTFLTDLPQSQIDAMRARVAAGELHPMQAKKDLAHTITSDFHTNEEADHAAANWATQFQQRGVADDLPEVEVSLVGATNLVRTSTLLVLAGLASSNGEATRKILENAVSVNGEKTKAISCYLRATDGADGSPILGESPTLRVGKRAVRVKWTA